MGYRSPRKVRYLHKSGLKQELIKSLKDLEGLDPKKYGLIISSSLGKKKKIVILKKAKEFNFNILNVKNPDDYIKKIEDRISAKKKAKTEKKKTTKEKIEKKEQKLSDKVSEEDKKELEKKEKDKILTKKQ